jgi:ABC-2 type transport system ATP-binding protein
MSDIAIKVKKLEKEFIFSVKDEKKGFFTNLFSPTIKKVLAVDDINFDIKKGERIAFIGPNGAGKSTTIKMLTGILFPSSGSITVLGLNPQNDRKKLAYKIGTVFGQRSQMFPNLPLTDSMYFFGVMFDLPKKVIEKRMVELCDIFDLNEFKNQPVRKLSLGQRMRAEVACALIHKPEIIFLDEPTIGLDVIAKKSLRELLLKLNREEGTTIFLTSHDVGDIETLCERTMIINHGQVVKDLPTDELVKTFVHEKYIDLIVDESDKEDLPIGVEYKNFSKNKISLIIDLKIIELKDALKKLLDIFPVVDINVYDVDLETVIREIYTNK